MIRSITIIDCAAGKSLYVAVQHHPVDSYIARLRWADRCSLHLLFLAYLTPYGVYVQRIHLRPSHCQQYWAPSRAAPSNQTSHIWWSPFRIYLVIINTHLHPHSQHPASALCLPAFPCMAYSGAPIVTNRTVYHIRPAIEALRSRGVTRMGLSVSLSSWTSALVPLEVSSVVIYSQQGRSDGG
jgi:hypothetical protein